MSVLRRRVAAAAVAALAAGFIPLLGAAPAGAATGALKVTPTTGFDATLMTFDTPQACTADALDTNVEVYFDGGNVASGDRGGLVPNSAQSTYPTNSQGGLTLGSAVSFQDAAASLGIDLHGQTYTITTNCRRAAGSTVFDTFTAQVTFGASGAAGSIPYSVVGATTPTSIALSPATATITTAQSQVLTATISPSGATGTVEFDQGATVLANNVAVSAGTAQYTFSSSTLGTYHITAKFTGTGSFGNSGPSNESVVTVNAPPTTAPTVNVATSVAGSHVTGGALTCTAATFNGTAPITTTLSWLRAGTAIAGATATTYNLSADDFGKAIACRTVGTNSAGSATSDSAAVTTGLGPAPAPRAGHAPKVTGAKKGKAKVGQTLAVNAGAWSVPVKAKFQWLRNGKAIKGATKQKYKLAKGDKGKKVSCKITFTATGYATKVVKTGAIAVS